MKFFNKSDKNKDKSNCCNELSCKDCNKYFDNCSDCNCDSCQECCEPIIIVGAKGSTGAAGPTGATGASGGSTIIPLSSGIAIPLNTIEGGLPGTPSFIGLGSSAIGNEVLGPTIDFTGDSVDLLNFAFSMPRAGIIKSISAFFSTTGAILLTDSFLTIRAQLYVSATPNNVFVAIPDAYVDLAPSLTGDMVPADTICNGVTTNLSIPITAQSRLLMVFSASATGTSLENTILGYASAGIEIE